MLTFFQLRICFTVDERTMKLFKHSVYLEYYSKLQWYTLTEKNRLFPIGLPTAHVP